MSIVSLVNVFMSLTQWVFISSKYCFESEVKMDSSMNWKDGQLHDIYYGKSTKRPGGGRRK